MKTLLKRAATLAWVCAIIVFGLGSFVLASAVVVRGLTPVSAHETTVWIDGNLGRSTEFRRPTMAETLIGFGVAPDFLTLSTGTAFVIVFLGACVVPWWYVRRAPENEQSGSEAIQELHHAAEDLLTRMEALETLLLERGRRTCYEESTRLT